MAIIPWPAGARIKTIQWSLDRPATVNRSAWTGRRQVIANPWHGKWSAKVELVPIIGEANVLAWRAFLALTKGQLNMFRLPATEGAQTIVNGNATTITVSGAGQSGNTLATANWVFTDGVTIAMKAGQMLTVNDQLLINTQDFAVSGTGVVNMAVEPAVRASPTNGSHVELIAPTCLVALTDSQVGWSVEPGKIYGITLQVEEAF